MTERGDRKRRRESADALREPDRALIDHSFRKGEGGEGGRGGGEMGGKRRGGLMEEREGGVHGVIHRIYEGQRQGRWALRQA